MSLVLYSPAPPTTRLHALNVLFGDRLADAGLDNEVVAVPLPDAINGICELPNAERARHLPIVTSADFLPAVHRTGPDWHAYTRANADLTLLGSLYDVAFGITVVGDAIRTPDDLRGRRVHAPPRPSAVRLLTEALLFEGWGLAGEVELVDSRPPDLAPLLSNAALEATSWNITTLEGVDGCVPQMDVPHARFLPVDAATLARVNDRLHVRLGGCRVGGVPLLAFRQGIAVWSETPPDICDTILDVLEGSGAPFFASLADIAAWPDLDDTSRHPALRRRMGRPLA